MFYVLKPKTIKTELICFNKKVSINDNSYNIFISYKKNDSKKDFILQTPIMITPFGISEFGSNKYIDLSFINMNEDDEIRYLYNKIKEINGHILKHMRYKHKCYKRNFINSIKQSSGIYPERIRLSINSQLKIYDKYNQLIDLDSIKSRTLTKALIHVSHIWLNNNKFGIFWNIVQLKTYGKLVLEEFQFLDEDCSQYTIKIPNINTIPPPPPPPLPAPIQDKKYEKYFKMLKMGINENAVKQKMVMDNVDPNILDNNPSCDILCINNNKNKKFVDSKKNLLSEIKNGFKLKSFAKEKKNIKKNNLLAPSLWEIKNKLKNLKKVNNINKPKKLEYPVINLLTQIHEGIKLKKIN